MAGSLTDLVVQLEVEVTVGEVSEAYLAAGTDGPLKSYLHYSTDPIVSSDIVGTPWSCTFDAPLTMASGDQVKVIGWYDNGWGYSNRLADLAAMVASSLGGSVMRAIADLGAGGRAVLRRADLNVPLAGTSTRQI